jgi:hypothetical protein
MSVGAETSGHAYELQLPHPELQRLDPLVGVWRCGGHTVGAPFGREMDVESTERFRWLKGGYVLISAYRISCDGSQPPDDGVMYWGYKRDRGRFKTYFFKDQGPFDSQLSTYEGVVDSDGSIDTEWFLRDADGEWKPWRHHRYSPRPTPDPNLDSFGSRLSTIAGHFDDAGNAAVMHPTIDDDGVFHSAVRRMSHTQLNQRPHRLSECDRPSPSPTIVARWAPSRSDRPTERAGSHGCG